MNPEIQTAIQNGHNWIDQEYNRIMDRRDICFLMLHGIYNDRPIKYPRLGWLIPLTRLPNGKSGVELISVTPD